MAGADLVMVGSVALPSSGPECWDCWFVDRRRQGQKQPGQFGADWVRVCREPVPTTFFDIPIGSLKVSHISWTCSRPETTLDNDLISCGRKAPMLQTFWQTVTGCEN